MPNKFYPTAPLPGLKISVLKIAGLSCVHIARNWRKKNYWSWQTGIWYWYFSRCLGNFTRLLFWHSRRWELFLIFSKLRFYQKLNFADKNKSTNNTAQQMPDYFSEGSILSENICEFIFQSLSALLLHQREHKGLAISYANLKFFSKLGDKIDNCFF